MYVKKIKDTISYEAPNHQKCHSLRLSGFEEYGPENFWVGHSQFLPGGGAGPDASPLEQYEFATSFLKVGDYSTAERAFREFVLSNPDHELAGSAQYWYAETFRIRQLYTDAASAYLEGYQKYPKGKKAPINLLKLGVSMVQIGEKDQGCKMINGVELQYPNANQSVIQKAKYESKKFECIKQDS